MREETVVSNSTSSPNV